MIDYGTPQAIWQVALFWLVIVGFIAALLSLIIWDSKSPKPESGESFQKRHWRIIQGNKKDLIPYDWDDQVIDWEKKEW